MELLKFWLSSTFSIADYNQQDATFLNLFISVRRSTCFRRSFRPSSGALNCTFSVRYLSDQYLTLYVQFWAPDDGRKTRLKHVERLTEINKLWSVASCWLCSANILAMHGHMNVKFKNTFPILSSLNVKIDLTRSSTQLSAFVRRFKCHAKEILLKKWKHFSLSSRSMNWCVKSRYTF